MFQELWRFSLETKRCTISKTKAKRVEEKIIKRNTRVWRHLPVTSRKKWRPRHLYRCLSITVIHPAILHACRPHVNIGWHTHMHTYTPCTIHVHTPGWVTLGAWLATILWRLKLDKALVGSATAPSESLHPHLIALGEGEVQARPDNGEIWSNLAFRDDMSGVWAKERHGNMALFIAASGYLKEVGNYP